jgi:hypothetical protein
VEISGTGLLQSLKSAYSNSSNVVETSFSQENVKDVLSKVITQRNNVLFNSILQLIIMFVCVENHANFHMVEQ